MIEFKNVTKKFDSSTLININKLNINRGEVFGFLGPNGAGKTTTIKMLVGLLKPDTGSIKINNYDISAQPKEAKKMFFFIPDTPSLYENLTGREFIKFIANLYGIKDSVELDNNIEKLLIQLELKDKGDNLIETYSHGMIL